MSGCLAQRASITSRSRSIYSLPPHTHTKAPPLVTLHTKQRTTQAPARPLALWPSLANSVTQTHDRSPSPFPRRTLCGVEWVPRAACLNDIPQQILLPPPHPLPPTQRPYHLPLSCSQPPTTFVSTGSAGCSLCNHFRANTTAQTPYCSPPTHRTLCGRPMSGCLAQRASITSLSRSFCPLYVVRMVMRSAG
jgi:hypothetical protein